MVHRVPGVKKSQAVHEPNLYHSVMGLQRNTKPKSLEACEERSDGALLLGVDRSGTTGATSIPDKTL